MATTVVVLLLLLSNGSRRFNVSFVADVDNVVEDVAAVLTNILFFVFGKTLARRARCCCCCCGYSNVLGHYSTHFTVVVCQVDEDEVNDKREREQQERVTQISHVRYKERKRLV